MAIKRDKEVKLRLSEEEHAILMAKKNKARLAEWIRETCLSEQEYVRKPAAVSKALPPVVALEFSKIGSNINQLTKAMHIAVKHSNDLELKEIAEKIRFHLVEMEEHMNDIRVYLLTR